MLNASKRRCYLLRHKKLVLFFMKINKTFWLIGWKKRIDYDDLQLHTTSLFEAYHVDAYDLDCDDEATACAIFMASISPVESLNGDTSGSSYDSEILLE
ncbi:hypothetical protein Tco_0042594, partial [Tanacetum coccineum]